MDVEANGVVVGTTGNGLDRGVSVAAVDNALDLVEGVAVDDRAHESLEILVGVSNGDFLHALLQASEEFLSTGLGDVDTRSGRALLALVLERATDGVVHSALDISCGVEEVEILAAGLSNDTRELAVGLVGNTVANLAVERAEDVRRPNEVQTSEFTVRQSNVGDGLRVTGNELDNVRRKASLQQDVVNELTGVDVGGRGLPEHNVTQQSWSRDQVTANGSEVEGRDSVNESLQGTVVQTAPHAITATVRLLVENLTNEVAVETEEVSQLSSGIDLGLPDVLALAEHSGSNQVITVLSSGQLGGLEEDSSSVDERSLLPFLLGL